MPNHTPPHSVLCTPETCFIGRTPAKTVTINTLTELHRLPEVASAWCRQTHGSVSGIVSYVAGAALHGVTSTQSPTVSATSLTLSSGTPLAEVAFFEQDQLASENVDQLLAKQISRKERFKLLEHFKCNTSFEAYEHLINQIHQYEQAGDCYQVNFARQFTARYAGSPFCAFTQLIGEHPAPWASYMKTASGAVFSCSPEAFLRVKGSNIATYPIKGSRPRGHTPQADARLQQDLLQSKKDKAENLMIVDLLRNDLGRLCKAGSIKVDKLFQLQQFSNVQHLVSHISGELLGDVHSLDALISCFPGGSITGAPKKRAMEIIDELENHSRGYYCGSQFWLHANGDMDSNILIRSFQASNGKISCFGGGGIVVDSSAQSEFDESTFKVEKLMNALSRS